MGLIGTSIVEFDFFPDAPPAIVGELVTGKTVNIELWHNGTGIIPTASDCSEINATGRYSWSTGNIETLAASRMQYHWRMSDGDGNTDEGDFVLISHENRDGMMPSLDNKGSYIQQI